MHVKSRRFWKKRKTSIEGVRCTVDKYPLQKGPPFLFKFGVHTSIVTDLDWLSSAGYIGHSGQLLHFTDSAMSCVGKTHPVFCRVSTTSPKRRADPRISPLCSHIGIFNYFLQRLSFFIWFFRLRCAEQYHTRYVCRLLTYLFGRAAVACDIATTYRTGCYYPEFIFMYRHTDSIEEGLSPPIFSPT